MTASKISKSSFSQSFNSDDGSVLADVGHFEDIGLDDDNDTVTLKSPAEVSIRLSSLKSPPSGRTLLQHSPQRTHLASFSHSPEVLTSPSMSSLPFPRRRTPSPGYSLNRLDPSRPPKPTKNTPWRWKSVVWAI
ncbi:hypothetical protein B0J13DRAFT_680089 [Dactylonectria estremocensis]|uniref:Uncharacterized protein n=1 Tax=Dactylonectria estremocensis TaxID=1079267 RepID=A0A9P9DQY0_9HYPO|nr:hypothetical protein B0J13DRAFT_680089 [Dactylonectria estremocensis]